LGGWGVVLVVCVCVSVSGMLFSLCVCDRLIFLPEARVGTQKDRNISRYQHRYVYRYVYLYLSIYIYMFIYIYIWYTAVRIFSRRPAHRRSTSICISICVSIRISVYIHLSISIYLYLYLVHGGKDLLKKTCTQKVISKQIDGNRSRYQHR